MKPNKKHKDSLFSTLFNDPDVLRELKNEEYFTTEDTEFHGVVYYGI